MPTGLLSDIVDAPLTKRASLADIVDVAPAPMISPADAERTIVPATGYTSPPGEVDAMKAWSLSPARDALAARRGQPAANVAPDSSPIPPPPPLGRVGMLTGQPVPPLPPSIPVLDAPAEGAQQIGTGLRGLWQGMKARFLAPRTSVVGQPMQPAEMNAASDVLEGGFKVAEPLVAGAALAAPIPTAIGLAGAFVAQKAGEKAAEFVGGGPEAQRLTGNVAALAGGGALAHEAMSRGGAALDTLADRGRILRENAPAEPEMKNVTPRKALLGDIIDAEPVKPTSGLLGPGTPETSSPEAPAAPQSEGLDVKGKTAALSDIVSVAPSQPAAAPVSAWPGEERFQAAMAESRRFTGKLDDFQDKIWAPYGTPELIDLLSRVDPKERPYAVQGMIRVLKRRGVTAPMVAGEAPLPDYAPVPNTLQDLATEAKGMNQENAANLAKDVTPRVPEGVAGQAAPDNVPVAPVPETAMPAAGVPGQVNPPSSGPIPTTALTPESSRITPSQPPSIRRLIDQREAEVRSGALAAQATGNPAGPVASVRATTYRDAPGFTVQWSDPNKVGPQRIFTKDRAIADQLKAAVRAGASADEMDRVLIGKSQVPASGTAHVADIVDASPGRTDIKSGTTLEAAVIPGMRQFVEHDVTPTLKAAAEQTHAAKEDIHALFAPDTIGAPARTFAGIMRANLAAHSQRIQRAQRSLGALERSFDRRSNEKNLAFIDAIERGASHELSADEQPAAATLRQLLDDKRTQVQERGRLQQYIENYFPHEWADPSKAQQLIRRIFGKKPLAGSKNFLKQRTIPTVKEGVAKGLTPISYNPITLALRKLIEMDKFLMGTDILTEAKGYGVSKFVRVGQEPPEDWQPYHESFGRVYGKGEKGELIVRGRYYGPPEAVRLLNNHLSPGLRKNAAFNLYRRAGNALNQVQLGLSAFHLTMTGLEAVVSKGAQGLQELSRGELGHAAKTIAQTPFATFVDLFKGHKALQEFYETDANAKQFASITDQIIQGGGGFGWDLFNHDGAPAQFMKAMRQGNLPGAALRALPAVFELSAKPVMEWWVPRLKAGAYLDLARMELRTLGPEPSLEEVRRVLGGAWDSIDNRFGELRYDNLFWHAALKDLGMASVRALGWNVGTIREVGGAPFELAKQVADRPMRRVNTGKTAAGEPTYEDQKAPWLSNKPAYTASMVILIGMAGAIYQYLHTGERPSELKDYFFPKTGGTLPNGTPERASLPSYMKDVYAYSHALPGSAVETVKHKLNPILNVLADMWTNQDYFGTEIRNPDDPLVQQAKDVFKYLADTAMPISIRSFQRRQEDSLKSGERGIGASESFLGVTPAPASVTRSKAETMMRDFEPPSTRTHDQADAADLRRKIREGLKAGTPEGQRQAAAAAGSGDLSRRQILNAVRQSRATGLQTNFQRLTVDQALRVYQVATEDERAALRDLLLAKANRSIPQAPPNDQAELLKRARAAVDLPYTKISPLPALRRTP